MRKIEIYSLDEKLVQIYIFQHNNVELVKTKLSINHVKFSRNVEKIDEIM